MKSNTSKIKIVLAVMSIAVTAIVFTSCRKEELGLSGNTSAVAAKQGPDVPAIIEVPEGNECGLQFDGKLKLEVGDVIELYKEQKKDKKLVLR